MKPDYETLRLTIPMQTVQLRLKDTKAKLEINNFQAKKSLDCRRIVWIYG